MKSVHISIRYEVKKLTLETMQDCTAYGNITHPLSRIMII